MLLLEKGYKTDRQTVSHSTQHTLHTQAHKYKVWEEAKEESDAVCFVFVFQQRSKAQKKNASSAFARDCARQPRPKSRAANVVDRLCVTNVRLVVGKKDAE